jgi:hypothetical protein
LFSGRPLDFVQIVLSMDCPVLPDASFYTGQSGYPVFPVRV